VHALLHDQPDAFRQYLTALRTMHNAITQNPQSVRTLPQNPFPRRPTLKPLAPPSCRPHRRSLACTSRLKLTVSTSARQWKACREAKDACVRRMDELGVTDLVRTSPRRSHSHSLPPRPHPTQLDACRR